MKRVADSVGEARIQRPQIAAMPYRVFLYMSKFLYVVAAVALLLFSLLMIGVAAWNVVDRVFSEEALFRQTLESIGLIIVSIAVFDVAKFLVEEEVFRDRELREPSEARNSLTKFMTIIIIATSLEALVLIFDTKRDAITDIVFPGMLMMVAVLALVGLAAFLWLSDKAETRDRDIKRGTKHA